MKVAVKYNGTQRDVENKKILVKPVTNSNTEFTKLVNVLSI